MFVDREVQFSGRIPAGGKYRVAAYCRVSTDMDSQQGSIDLQKKVYSAMIQANPLWELAGLYADTGLSGTSVKRRNEFSRMMKDAETGKIDYIITKSISRFARNTLECLKYVRHLRDMGVELYFEKENLDTGAVFSELLLTVFAAFAQEESRSISENVKWGIRKRFEAGEDKWTNCFGYTQGENGEYMIVPEEAMVVRQIFQLYEMGWTCSDIQTYFDNAGIPSPTGNPIWTKSVITRILSNEKYAGDILLQKYYTVDHLTHHKVRNNGEVQSNYLRDHHVPIVTRKTFDRVTTIREMRYQGGGKGNKDASCLQYPFHDLLKCPYCGATLRRQKVNVQGANGGWCCPDCGDFIIRASLVEYAVVGAYNSIDPEVIKDLNETPNKKVLIGYKDVLPTTESADFYWLDDLVDHISFGQHSHSPSELRNEPQLENDNSVIVYWKAGLKTSSDSMVHRDADMPRHVADLYRKHIERKQAPEGVVA